MICRDERELLEVLPGVVGWYRYSGDGRGSSSAVGVGGAQIFRAESTGPLKEGRLTPRISDTAKAFFNIYFAISVLCAICYHMAGMDWDDAIMHTFTTVSLGGFLQP